VRIRTVWPEAAECAEVTRSFWKGHGLVAARRGGRAWRAPA
jgi:hypothetical protein